MTASLCEYKFINGGTCGKTFKEKVYGTSTYCILHVELPDRSDPKYNDIIYEKIAKVQEKAQKGNFNFEGAKVFEVNFSGKDDIKDLNFTNATIQGGARFDGATIQGSALFDGAKIQKIQGFIEIAWVFNRIIIPRVGEKPGDASFYGATIQGNALFEGATIQGFALFDGAKIQGNALFDGAEIQRDVCFDGAKIQREAWFNGAKILGEIFQCQSTEINGTFLFKDAKFKNMKAQEEACRKAKQTLEHLGRRDEADYHFYREMEAMRKQKKPDISFREAVRRWWRAKDGDSKGEDAGDNSGVSDSSAVKKYVLRYAEYLAEAPIQYVIGYWVKPLRVLEAFALFVVIFGALFWLTDAVQFTFETFLSNLWRISFLWLRDPATLFWRTIFWLTSGQLTADAFLCNLGLFWSNLGSSFLALFDPISSIREAQTQTNTLRGRLTLIAGFIGIFTWPVFIASLAKKYGR